MTFDLESDLPPLGATVTCMVAGLWVSRTWVFAEHGWTTYDGCGQPEMVARPFTEAGKRITASWICRKRDGS